MSVDTPQLEHLSHPLAADDLDSLARLLVRVVAEGEAVSFLAPLDLEAARSWWRAAGEGLLPAGLLLAFRAAGRIVATVQLQPAWAPNQPHRAEVLKLLVDPDHRRRGLARRLMEALEAEARNRGFWLLTLDAKKGAAAESLYRSLGFIEVGSIPDFALDPDASSLHDAILFYRDLR